MIQFECLAPTLPLEIDKTFSRISILLFFSVALSRSSIFAIHQLLEFRFLNCLNHTFSLIISWIILNLLSPTKSSRVKYQKTQNDVSYRGVWFRVEQRGEWVSHRTAACSLFTFSCDLFFLCSLATQTKTRQKLFPSLPAEGCFREKLRRMKSEEKFEILNNAQVWTVMHRQTMPASDSRDVCN